MVHDKVSPIWQPQAILVGFEDLPCHPKGVVDFPGDGVGEEGEATGEGQYCRVKNLFQKNKQTILFQDLHCSSLKIFAF